MASLFTTMYTLTNRMGLICGDEGFIEVENINNPRQIRVYAPDRDNPQLLASYDAPEQISGYEYEVLSCKKAIEEGRIECPEMPHSETIQIMAHYDVVPAEESEWDFDPFSGEMKDGFICGRGSLDTKCTLCSVMASSSGQAAIVEGLANGIDAYFGN